MQQDVVNYIQQAQRHGLTDLEIKQNLLDAGWEAALVEEGFAHAKTAESQPVTSPHEETTVKNLGSQTGQPLKLQPDLAPAGMVAPTQSVIQPSVQSTQADQNMPVAAKTGHKKLWLSIALVVVLAALGGGGAYAYFSGLFQNPTALWSKFLKATTQPIYNNTFNFTYSDPGQLPDDTGSLGFQLKDIKLQLSGNSYINATDAQNPQASSTIQYTFGSGNTNFSTGLGYIVLDNVLYLNVGDNPFFASVSAELNNGQKINWLKIDYNELKNQNAQAQNEVKFFQQLTDPDFKKQLQKIWDDTTLVKIDKFVGREKINGVTTLHFQNSLDKQALKGMVNQYTQFLTKTMQADGSTITADDQAYVNELAAQLIDKLQVKQFDTWIGASDARLYQVKLTTNAPSLISLVKNSQNFNLNQSHDTTRVMDVRQMASALELYYNDHNGYPDGKGGKPLDLTPNYIAQLPTAPAADGTCTDYFNAYWYKPAGNKKVINGKTVYDSYTLTFCLGTATGGYKAGIGKLTPSGIQDNIPCPVTLDLCVKNAATQDDSVKKQVNDFIAKLDFSAEVTANVTYNNYGQKQQLTAPADAFDVVQTIEQAQGKSADAKRIADIRQLASALELYFNDHNSYPPDLKSMTPTYIGLIPAAPEPPGGSCSEADNTYTYKLINSGSYQLTFCLGGQTGGYSAGKHTLTQAGIQ